MGAGVAFAEQQFSAEMFTAMRALAGIYPAGASDLGVNGQTMKQLWQRGFVSPVDDLTPPLYEPTPKGFGAIEVLTAKPSPVPYEGPIGRIKRAVADVYGITEIDLASQRRERRVAHPRQVAMYLAKRLTKFSLPEIGRRFGNRDHTTVIHACRQVEKRMAADAALRERVEELALDLVQGRLGA